MTDAEIIEWLNGITDNREMMAAWNDLVKNDRPTIIRIYKDVVDRLAAALNSPEVVEDLNRRETERAIALGNLTRDELMLVDQVNSCGDHVTVGKWARSIAHEQPELYRKIFPAIQHRYFRAVDSFQWKSYIGANTQGGSDEGPRNS